MYSSRFVKDEETTSFHASSNNKTVGKTNIAGLAFVLCGVFFGCFIFSILIEAFGGTGNDLFFLR